MNVADLKKMLEILPDEMEIVNRRYSDYQIVSADEWHIINGVDKDGWIMRSHPTMSDENKAKEKQYLYLEGN